MHLGAVGDLAGQSVGQSAGPAGTTYPDAAHQCLCRGSRWDRHPSLS